MPKTKHRTPPAAAEQWRQFWNSIGGSEVDPSSRNPKPTIITQKELDNYLRCCEALTKTWDSYEELTRALLPRRKPTRTTWEEVRDAWVNLVELYAPARDNILQALRRRGTQIEPGPLSVVKNGRKRSFRILRQPAA